MLDISLVSPKWSAGQNKNDDDLLLNQLIMGIEAAIE